MEQPSKRKPRALQPGPKRKPGRPPGAFNQGKEWVYLKLQGLGEKSWPSNEYLASERGCSVTQIKRYIRALAEEGRLRRSCWHYKKYGKLLSKRFIFLLQYVAGKVKAFFGVPRYPETDETSQPAVPVQPKPVSAVAPAPLVVTIDPDIQKMVDEEEAEDRAYAARMADPEFLRKKSITSFFRFKAHELLGGFNRPIRQSPQVQAMLDNLDQENQ